MTGRKRLGVAAGMAAVVLWASAPGHAQTAQAASACASAEVSARGEPASYRWLAVMKARGNWRSKVRAMPGLGAAFANFGSSQNPVERCIFNTGSIACTVSATPCRR